MIKYKKLNMTKTEKDEIVSSPKAKSASGIINVISKKPIRSKHNGNKNKKVSSDTEYSSNSEEEEVSEEETEEDSEEQEEDSDEETEESEEESEDNNKKKKNKKLLKKNISKTIKAFDADTKKRKIEHAKKSNMRKLIKEKESEDFTKLQGGYDEKQFNKILQKMFPSKYIKQKAQELKNEIVEQKKKSKKNKNKKKSSREQEYVIVINDPSYDDDDSDYDPEEDEDYETEEEYDSYEEYDSEEESEEDSDSDEEEEEDEEETDDEEDKKKNKSKKEKDLVTYENEKKMLNDWLDEINEREKNNIYSTKESKRIINKTRKNIKDEIKQLEKKEEKQFEQEKRKNAQEFRKQIGNKYGTTDSWYFAEKLKVNEQKKILEEFKEVNKAVQIEKPYRIALMETNIPQEFKACALKKINMLRQMEPGAGEYYKVKNWIDTFMKIPFNTYKNFDITIDDGIDKCDSYLQNAKQQLDKVVYGLDDAKMQIMQMMGQLITNPSAVGTSIAIHGPMGTGKTTLVKEGISKILGRDFAFIALGGATDSSFLEGHSYTYEGSLWGQIVDILIRCKSMNPVIYFDELDKVSDTPKGEEIIGILTHLTDTSQNNEFHDKFFAEINFDLSKCLFIFSYNDETKINPILRDRMYRIQTKGYNMDDKKNIATKYLLPKINEQVKFKDEDIILDDDVIGYMVENYTNSEKGIRTLKRCIETIHTKLNLYRLIKPDTKLFENETTLEVKFPFKVTREVVQKLLKNDNKEKNLILSTIYC